MLEFALQNIEISLPCKPFRCTKSEQIGKDLHLYFEPADGLELCPDCGNPFQVNQWRDITLLGPPEMTSRSTFWHVHYRVYACRWCRNYKSQEIPFRFLRTGCTTYLARKICDDMQAHNSTVKDVCRRYGLGWWRVKSVHKAFLKLLSETLPKPDAPNIAAVDEFSVEKNHKYATFVINAENKQPLYLHSGNKEEDFEPFFHKYSKSFYSKLKAFAMDQNAGYAAVVKRHLPDCAIVCDYFHMIKNYNDQVIDPIRARMIRSAAIERDSFKLRLLKGAKRLMMKKIAENDISAMAALKDLMDENRDLDTAIHMREHLQLLYDKCRNVEVMKSGWTRWLEMAKASAVPELMAFAKRKALKSEEVINHARYAISSGVMEGCMAKIKVLKRVAYGFRDWDYFFLRIWHSFLPRDICTKYSEQIWQLLEA